MSIDFKEEIRYELRERTSRSGADGILRKVEPGKNVPIDGGMR